MKDGILVFPVVPHKYGELVHHLGICPFPDNFDFYYVPGPFLRDDEELGCPREVVDIL